MSRFPFILPLTYESYTFLQIHATLLGSLTSLTIDDSLEHYV